MLFGVKQKDVDCLNVFFCYAYEVILNLFLFFRVIWLTRTIGMR